MQTNKAKDAVNNLSINPHRLQLGNIGLVLVKNNGDTATIKDIENIQQQLNVYTGILESSFTLDAIPAKIFTLANQQQDGISFSIYSPLIKQNKLFVYISFPYPTGDFSDKGVYYSDQNNYYSNYQTINNRHIVFTHVLDTTKYYIDATWSSNIKVDSSKKNEYVIKPVNTSSIEADLIFESKKKISNYDFEKIKKENILSWKNFWESGGAIDFAGSKDTRANELERRIILSEYLTKVQCAGDFPPQETGLTYNSWYGKQHLEMYWWHAAHFAFWGRPQLLEKRFDWFISVADKAKAIAKRQGFDGVRWQKMTDPQGDESPASVGNFLIWQQPHFIYLAELLYNTKNDKTAILNKYKKLVFETADFMASFAVLDSSTGKYNLGKGLIPAQEWFNPFETYNPPYELAYWKWALNVAQQWRINSGLPRDIRWDNVLNHLAPLPEKNGLYLAAANATDSYSPSSKFIDDHPAVLAAVATIPFSKYIDSATMHRTFDTINKVWHWETTWGWDYPLMAMAATRMDLNNAAVDMLMRTTQKNTYLPNGNNYQNDELTVYLPGNGGLLSAIAMMCAGFDGSQEKNPGFNKDNWNIKWEGLSQLP